MGEGVQGDGGRSPLPLHIPRPRGAAGAGIIQNLNGFSAAAAA